MVTLERILVPTDLSETAERAAEYGSELAQAFGATLHVLYVIENTPAIGSAAAGAHYKPPPPSLIAPVEHEIMEELKTALAALQTKPPAVLPVVRTGNPFVEIIRYAGEQRIDLIVMGTHGRGPVAHLLLGSVAENVVRQATCPVLTVRRPEHSDPAR